MSILKKDREIIRNLAKQQLEYANLPEMKARKQLWLDHNDVKGSFTPVTIEKGTFGSELERPLYCTDSFARWVELGFQNTIIQYEDIQDDSFIGTDYFMSTDSYFKPFNIDIVNEAPKSGKSVGFHTVLTINDLEKDFHKLGKSNFGYDTTATNEKKDILSDVIGDLMPVKVIGSPFCFSLTQIIVNLMGMENMFTSMYDYPELLHQMLGMVTDDFISYMNLLEKDGIIKPNNNHQWIAQGTVSPTTRLPRSKCVDGKALISDTWGYMDSQETVGISPAMFEEFFFPYYKKVGDMFGLLNYACCEPVDKIWDNCISKFTNLRKLSISPWCDEEYIGDRLRGTSTIFHRKPSPNYIGVGEVFDEIGFTQHIKRTALAARGCKLEFSYRDVYTLMGQKWRPKKAYQIIKETVDKYWHA